MVDRSSLVETYDLGIPRRKLQSSVAEFFNDHPAYKRSDSSYLDDIRTILLTIDLAEPALLIGFHRLNTCQESFTRREIRILEFLRPHLCQAIKTLALREGLVDRISPTEKDPLESLIPMVQVAKDSKIVCQNSKFKEFFNFQPGDNLSSSLARFLERKIIEYEKSSNAQIPETEFFWYCLCPSLFQVEITRSKDDLWLLKLHPVSDPCPGSNSLLKQYGLTPKEKEVCCGVRQGFDNQEIASQLFISFHTAKTHLKNIYRKLGIPNRPRLVSFLNRK
jgi:DNA-binding CsgD family transcriptional regulator